MKHLLIISILSLFVWSCQKKSDDSFGQSSKDEMSIENNSIALGEELFKGKGTCTACHLADKKVIGPSIAEISATYKEKGASIAAF